MKCRPQSRECLAPTGRNSKPSNAQAAAFHAEFVSLLNGSGAAYLATELANAQQALQSAMAPAAASAASDPLGGLLGGLGGVLGAVAAPQPPAPADSA